jgi:hypothetical protein
MLLLNFLTIERSANTRKRNEGVILGPLSPPQPYPKPGSAINYLSRGAAPPQPKTFSPRMTRINANIKVKGAPAIGLFVKMLLLIRVN